MPKKDSTLLLYYKSDAKKYLSENFTVEKIFPLTPDTKAVIGKNMDFDSGVLDDFVYRDHKAQIPNIEWKEPLKVEIAHFLDCIKNNSECLTDTIHAKGVVEVLSF